MSASKLLNLILCLQNLIQIRDGSKAAATSKIVHFVIIVNGWKPLTIITKRSILKVAAALRSTSADIKLLGRLLQSLGPVSPV